MLGLCYTLSLSLSMCVCVCVCSFNITIQQQPSIFAQLTVFVGILNSFTVKSMMVVVQRFANQLLTGIVDQVLHPETHTHTHTQITPNLNTCTMWKNILKATSRSYLLVKIKLYTSSCTHLRPRAQWQHMQHSHLIYKNCDHKNFQ